MITVTTGAEMRRRSAAFRGAGERIALVPTMGALHAGHFALVEHARGLADRVVVSVFVNPTQFDDPADLARYPRQPAEDARLLAAAGADVLFLPPADEVYPPGDATAVVVAGPAEGLEGACRPGHFRGVATVVARLFHLVAPDLAVFGEKDAQQLAVVRRMVADLHLPVEIVGHPTVREADGLAMSSRNARLDPAARRAATVLHRALEAGREAVVAARAGAEAGRAITTGAGTATGRAIAVGAATAGRNLLRAFAENGEGGPGLSAGAEDGAGAEGGSGAETRRDRVSGDRPAAATASPAHGADAVRRAMRRVLAEEPSAEVEYAEVVDAETFRPLERLPSAGRIVLPLAVRVGGVRLIDNLHLDLSRPDSLQPDQPQPDPSSARAAGRAPAAVETPPPAFP
jgi:pantoate--beta-alanine ligase